MRDAGGSTNPFVPSRPARTPSRTFFRSVARKRKENTGRIPSGWMESAFERTSPCSGALFRINRVLTCSLRRRNDKFHLSLPWLNCHNRSVKNPDRVFNGLSHYLRSLRVFLSPVPASIFPSRLNWIIKSAFALILTSPLLPGGGILRTTHLFFGYWIDNLTFLIFQWIKERLLIIVIALQEYDVNQKIIR